MSVKGNTRITMDAMQQIIDDLVLCDNPYNCPHGRPTIISFTKYELERMFKRVMNQKGDIMKNILKDDKSFYFIVGMSLLIPIIIGLVYVFATIYL